MEVGFVHSKLKKTISHRRRDNGHGVEMKAVKGYPDCRKDLSWQ